MKFTLILCVFLTLIPAAGIFCQEADSSKTSETGRFYFTLGPDIMINALRKNSSGVIQSAPTPVLFSVGFGADIPLFKWIQFSPYVNFFMNYYLWTGKDALPAEIEHRTAVVPAFLFDLPLTGVIRKKNLLFTAGVGIGILARFGVTASGITEDVSGEIKKINAYLWNDMRWFYPSIQASCDYIFPGGLGVGGGARLYLPVSAAKSGASFAHNMIICASLRLRLPPKK